MGNGTEALTCSGSLLVCATLLIFISGIPALIKYISAELAQKTASFLQVAGSLAGLCGAALVLTGEKTETVIIAAYLPFGPLQASADPLAALFLLPIFTITLCCAIYAGGYWPAAANIESVRKLTLFSGFLSASLALLVMAHNAILFLIAWEIMALSCYFVMTTEDAKTEVREAGLLYLITTHIGTLALFAMFSLLRGLCDSFQFPLAGSLDGMSAIASGIFVTALLGFGLKAGLMPLHVWLPAAHANAPSHISALMSGVLIKMGIYGLIRIFSLFNHIPLWWGAVILIAGIVSGIIGVVFAIAQHDLKRLLAYHSIENIGIIAMGIGVALIGQATGNQTLMILGMAGGLLHVLNHATFKALLFLCAGAMIHAAGTREIDLMGGLARRLPMTALYFLVGAVAICGLPPLNGFVSEFLIYLGLFNGVKGGNGQAVPFLALTAPALALIGGLAVACFVKVYGVAFLGFPRTASQSDSHECGWQMQTPMALLALICIFIGLFPQAIARYLEAAIFSWQPTVAITTNRLEQNAPLIWLSILSMLLLGLILIAAAFIIKRCRTSPQATAVTWDCGYLRPSPSMQYSASSFAEILVKLFNGLLQPEWKKPAISGNFPKGTHFASHVPETALELLFLPLLERANSKLAIIRRLQHGQLHLYILYIFVTLVLLLVWAQLA